MKVGTKVKWKSRSGETLIGVVSSEPIQSQKGDWIKVKTDAGKEYTLRPSQIKTA